MFKLAVALLLSALSGIASAGLFGPSNYEECILDSMKGVTSDMAARAVAQACRSKFPQKAKGSKCHVVWNGSSFALGTEVGTAEYELSGHEAVIAVAHVSTKLDESAANALIKKKYWEIVALCK